MKTIYAQAHPGKVVLAEKELGHPGPGEGVDVGVADVDQLDRVAGLLCASCKLFDQNAGRSGPVRASHQNNDLHKGLLIN